MSLMVQGRAGGRVCAAEVSCRFRYLLLFGGLLSITLTFSFPPWILAISFLLIDYCLKCCLVSIKELLEAAFPILEGLAKLK